MSEVYFSLDIETDGPIPGPNSMRSLGMVAFTPTCFNMANTFYAVLKPLPDSKVEASTLAWWMETPEKQEKWNDLQKCQEEPATVMRELDLWVRKQADYFKASPVCVASPAGYDFVFLRWYLISLLGGGETVFKHRCLDIRSYWMSICGKEYLGSSKDSVPDRLKPVGLPHTHNALEDALEQGQLIFNMMQEADQMRRAARSWQKLFPMAKAMNEMINLTKSWAGLAQ